MSTEDELNRLRVRLVNLENDLAEESARLTRLSQKVDRWVSLTDLTSPSSNGADTSTGGMSLSAPIAGAATGGPRGSIIADSSASERNAPGPCPICGGPHRWRECGP